MIQCLNKTPTNLMNTKTFGNKIICWYIFKSFTCESILKCWHNFLTEVFCWIWNFLLSSSFIGSPVSSFVLSLGGKGRVGTLGTGDMEWGLELCNQERQVNSPSSSSSSSSKYVGRLPDASQLVTSCFARSETPGRLIWKYKPTLKISKRSIYDGSVQTEKRG